MNRIVFAAVAVLITTFISTAPASAQHPDLPGCIGPPGAANTVWCGPTMPTGQHYRCEWRFLFNACDWRWSDNSIAPPV